MWFLGHDCRTDFRSAVSIFALVLASGSLGLKFCLFDLVSRMSVSGCFGAKEKAALV